MKYRDRERTGVAVRTDFMQGFAMRREHVITSPVMPERSGETVIG